MSKIDYQALREAAEGAKGKTTWQKIQAFKAVATPEVVLELLDVLDASQEAKPVAYMWDSERKDIDAPGYYRPEHLVFAESNVKQWGGRVIPLYTSPHTPVVPEEISTTHTMLPAMSDQLMAFGYVKGWNACRSKVIGNMLLVDMDRTATDNTNQQFESLAKSE